MKKKIFKGQINMKLEYIGLWPRDKFEKEIYPSYVEGHCYLIDCGRKDPIILVGEKAQFSVFKPLEKQPKPKVE